MNLVHRTLLLLVAIYVCLRWIYPRDREISAAYLRYLVLGTVSFIVISPFLWLICAVFKDKEILMRHTFLPPLPEWSGRTLNFDNFRMLFAAEQTLQGKVYFWQYAVNSLFLASTTTIVQLFFSSLGGFALAKYDFRGKKPLQFFMLGSLMVPGILFLAPVYRLVYGLGWMDTYWALIVPSAVSVFGMLLFRQAISSIPDSLVEAARIDGCSEFHIYSQIVMPLVRPMTGAFCLVTFLGSWNSFITPQIYIQTTAKLTMPVILNQYVGLYSQQYGVFLAGTLLAIIPPAALFFSLQREFVAGLTEGGVKA